MQVGGNAVGSVKTRFGLHLVRVLSERRDAAPSADVGPGAAWSILRSDLPPPPSDATPLHSHHILRRRRPAPVAVQEMSVEDLSVKLLDSAAEGVQLLDVREQHEWCGGAARHRPCGRHRQVAGQSTRGARLRVVFCARMPDCMRRRSPPDRPPAGTSATCRGSNCTRPRSSASGTSCGLFFLLRPDAGTRVHATRASAEVRACSFRRAPTLLGNLNPTAETIVLCHHGVRSRNVAEWLVRQAGFTEVYNVTGGIDLYARKVEKSLPRY